MIPIIVISLIGAVLAIAVYQLIIHKYYWGPGGPPDRKKQARPERKDKE